MAKANSEIFNKFGPASWAAGGVACVLMTSCPADSSRSSRPAFMLLWLSFALGVWLGTS